VVEGASFKSVDSGLKAPSRQRKTYSMSAGLPSHSKVTDRDKWINRTARFAICTGKISGLRSKAFNLRL